MKGLIAVALVSGASMGMSTTHAADLLVACPPDNDLYRVLVANDVACKRYDSAAGALRAAKSGSAVMVLARGYPHEKTAVPSGVYAEAGKRRVSLFVEFPDRIPSGRTGAVKQTKKERLVVTSDFFGAKLKRHRILDAGMYSYVATGDHECHLKGAKVAGSYTAVYGLEHTPNFPILFEDGGVLVATTRLSHFIEGRYSPLEAWATVLGRILSHLLVTVRGTELKWVPRVRPSYSVDERLPADAYRLAVERGAEWYIKGRFLIHPGWAEMQKKRSGDGRFPVGPAIDLTFPSGDGSLGVMEGHYSYVSHDGSQYYRYWLRADCVAETAMTLALAGALTKDTSKRRVARNLMDFLYFDSDLRNDDARASSYGLIGWADTHTGTYYGDDNARVLIGSIMAARSLEDTRWDTRILEAILGNFRTTGALGFRGPRLEARDIDRRTWQRLYAGKRINPHPHFESWLWATYLWLYDKTGRKPLLERSKKAIGITMAHYPDRWRWTNGIQQERARMILPLTWLVRVEDTAQHRAWLHQVCDALLKNQVACGVIREEVGKRGGQYGPPRSNRHYGTTEAPVIHANGDPIADMLYTSNFALFALNEAAHATRDPRYEAAAGGLADFLVRIQSRSDGRADLDGCWFRAFDFRSWEFYGSNADHGWGAWGTLTGWTQSFITSTLALRCRNTSFWDSTRKSTIGSDIDRVWEQMLPARLLPKPIEHAARNKSVTWQIPPDKRYPDDNNDLVNGLEGPPEYTDTDWVGWEGQDAEWTVDLGKPTGIRLIDSLFLRALKAGVHLPTRVVYSVSSDGRTYRDVAEVRRPPDAAGGPDATRHYTAANLNVTARLVRVEASSVVTIPSGFTAAGKKAWLFASEILVNPEKE